MALQITIAGSQVNFEEDSFILHQTIDERWRCEFTVIDYTGAQFYQRGSQVLVTDPVLGRLFQGYVIDDKQDKSNVYPDPTIEHQIQAIDNIYLAAKRTSNIVYTTPILSGKVVVDMVQQVLSQEGVVANYAVDHDTTQTDFSRGTLSNAVAANSVGDGDLELLSSSSASQSYTTQAQWLTGTLTNVQANSGGDLSLNGFLQNWASGVITNQTLFGQGSPAQQIVNKLYQLSCAGGNKDARSRFDVGGSWQNFTMAVDVTLNADNVEGGLVYRTTGWQNNNDTYAYMFIITTTNVQIGHGTNSSSGSGSFTPIATITRTFAKNTPYRLQVVTSGSLQTFYVNGTYITSFNDVTFLNAGQVALRVYNFSSATKAVTFANFGIMAALSGTWQSPAASIGSITSVASSVITWDTSLSSGGTVQVQTSIDGGSTFQTVSNGGAVNPGLTKGTNCTGKTLIILVTLSNTTTATMPDIRNLSWTITGGYSLSGSRSTAPLGNDTMVRANQSGWGTAFDGQTWHMVLGSTTAGDQDATVRFMLSTSTINAGFELRYQDTNDFYRCSTSVGTVTLTKASAGIRVTLANVNFSPALSTGVFYRMRFRVTGDGTAAPVNLQAKVWQDGTTEPTSWTITAQD